MSDPHRDGEASVQDRSTSAPESSSTSTLQLSHQDVRKKLSDYLDGSLIVTERQSIDGHLENCRDCRAFRDTLRQTVHALDSLTPHRAPPTAARHIRDLARAREVPDVAGGAR